LASCKPRKASRSAGRCPDCDRAMLGCPHSRRQPCAETMHPRGACKRVACRLLCLCLRGGKPSSRHNVGSRMPRTGLDPGYERRGQRSWFHPKPARRKEETVLCVGVEALSNSCLGVGPLTRIASTAAHALTDCQTMSPSPQRMAQGCVGDTNRRRPTPTRCQTRCRRFPAAQVAPESAQTGRF